MTRDLRLMKYFSNGNHKLQVVVLFSCVGPY